MIVPGGWRGWEAEGIILIQDTVIKQGQLKNLEDNIQHALMIVGMPMHFLKTQI